MRRTIPAAVSVLGLLSIPPEAAAQVGSMRVTVPSPTAASLGKFGDIPVSLYTGMPDISIPLFTAKGKTLELPITLSYHAGGIRVEEIGGWTGTGWTLEAGGTITRTVRGIVDEYWQGYYNTGHQLYDVANWPVPSSAWLQNASEEQVDGEPDQFFFSFAGRSGEIVIGPTTTSSSVKQYHAIPHQKWRIEPMFGAEGITSWVITTEDGTRYVFAAMETNTDYSLPTSGEIPEHYGRSYPSAWHLTSIEAPGGDVISLSYAPYTARHRLSTYYEKFDQIQSLGDPCRPDHYGVVNEYEVAGARLASITTATHTITFDATLRTDALSPTGVQQEPRLDRIAIATPAGTVLRRFQFEHDYSTGRLTLKRVSEQDRNGVSLPAFSFTYDATVLPALTSYAQDHWGFYNGKTSNNTFVPTVTTPEGYVLAGADRAPDAAFAKAAALTRITYPTGGYSEFVYEGHDYGAVGRFAEMPVGEGPLRFASAASWEGDGTTTFTVGGTDTAIVKVITQQSPGDCGTQIDPPCPYTEIVGEGGWNDSYAIHYVSLLPGTYTLRADDKGTYPDGWARIDIEWRDRGPLPKKPGGGLRVAEVRSADAMGNITVRRYRYTLQSDPTRSSGIVGAEPRYSYKFTSNVCSFFSRSSMSKMPLGGGPPVAYREVTVLQGAGGEFGTTRQTFRSVTDAPDPDPVGPWPFLRRTDLAWMRGQPSEGTEYSAAGQPQQRAASGYQFPNRARFQAMSFYFLSVGTAGSLEQPVGVYYYNPIEVFSSWVQQISETTTLFDEAGTTSIATSKAYVYGNPIHGQPTQVTETNSNGTERITRMKYPADYAPGTGNPEAAALTAMQGTAHIHNAVVERWVIEKTGATEKIVQAELTTFREYVLGQYLPYQRFLLNSPSPLP